ncbi:hypothetical protein DIPPA_00925 [Diplonema papillatum]|nr:hypothetical protein DIPPA_00925 [Diplonema papillatum]
MVSSVGSNLGNSNLPFPNPKKTFVQSRHSKLDTRGVIAAEHKIELSDLLQESTTELKAIYRSKFIFGDYLKYVDTTHAADGATEFNVAKPPPFEPTYVGQKKDDKPSTQAANDAEKEKLRTAEELIRKLYKRNSQLEIENKYLATIRQAARSGKPGPGSAGELGQIPRHPFMTQRRARRCKSTPPTRLLLQAHAQDPKNPRSGNGQNPSGAGAPPGADATSPADLGVSMLKQKVQSLTEALVATQHENYRLSKEKTHRVSLRDTLIKKYLVERDTSIAHLHALLQELAEKVHNPQKLTRVKQPPGSVNPVVLGNNILRETTNRLTEEISEATASLMQCSGNARYEALLSRMSTDPVSTSTSPPAPPADPPHNPAQPTAAPTHRRRELIRRVRGIVEGLPVGKKKSLLSLLLEIKQLNRSLVSSNATVIQTYEDLKARLNHDLVQEKLEAALLRDQVRALGGSADDDVLLTEGIPRLGFTTGG